MNSLCPQRLLSCIEFEYIPQLNVPDELDCGSQLPPLHHEALLELIGLRRASCLPSPTHLFFFVDRLRAALCKLGGCLILAFKAYRD
jgi:hypothetical protein